jgi:hypothetical protein
MNHLFELNRDHSRQNIRRDSSKSKLSEVENSLEKLTNVTNKETNSHIEVKNENDEC